MDSKLKCVFVQQEQEGPPSTIATLIHLIATILIIILMIFFCPEFF